MSLRNALLPLLLPQSPPLYSPSPSSLQSEKPSQRGEHRDDPAARQDGAGVGPVLGSLCQHSLSGASGMRCLSREGHLSSKCITRSSSMQTVFGIERLVDLTIAKKVPQVAYATTVAVRFINNVIGECLLRVILPETCCECALHTGGENFIDMARWAGVQ